MDKRKKYSKSAVMSIIAEYVIKEMTKNDLSICVETLYEDIVHYASVHHPNVPMPKSSQARKMIISVLTEERNFQSGERLTAEAIFRLKDIYYDDTDIESVLQKEYEMHCYASDIIICTIKLPPDDIIKKLMLTISENKKKSELWGKISTIQEICSRIKDLNSDNILAVIPECNRMIYLNEKGEENNKVKDLEPVCKSLCMFVKNTPTGQAIVDSLKSQTLL